MTIPNEREVSAPTTPGEAEGSENADEQSQTSPAPSQTHPVEGDSESPSED